MYLTRFRFNAARTGARRLLTSPQMLHAAVMSSFPDAPPAPDGGPRVLWRIDYNSAAEVLLYVTSPARPDLTHLVEQAGWPTAEAQGWSTYDYATFLTGLATDSVWEFRLTANPVHSIRRKEGEPTKRTAHRTPRYQIEWLLKQQDRSGFAIVEKAPEARRLERGDEYELVVGGARGLSFSKKNSSTAQGSSPAGKDIPATAGRNAVRIAAVTYQGRLRVTDPEVFRLRLASGLGKAKAYGCGLMTLAPVV
ncbi:type I-E CRISPR-associated protein Cas6/Cse3/CasE [Streptomyces sp. NBC_01257]|uniref:type I-E CRISPR-associated protein Cas6/Cse3/CasE n=1 Tax=Streptomyces sp. NBC_01257 TaxID=2903799 RepID=UPI002DDC5C85|nr:type I-E CRISPR-associated protein Cas6/Cse3/CasE [Streptomyces sp. NBC_01257]WRZ65856.1 type I-E CRISPR-associated protein Cas6/Cse3/CasE [Streptomyces sp. NBC_01257]